MLDDVLFDTGTFFNVYPEEKSIEYRLGRVHGGRASARLTIDHVTVEASADLHKLVSDVVRFINAIWDDQFEWTESSTYVRPEAWNRLAEAGNHYSRESFEYITGERGVRLDVLGPVSRLHDVAGVGVSARPKVTAGWNPYLSDHEY